MVIITSKETCTIDFRSTKTHLFLKFDLWPSRVLLQEECTNFEYEVGLTNAEAQRCGYILFKFKR